MKEKMVEIIQTAVGGCARHWALLIVQTLLNCGTVLLPCKIGETVWVNTKYGTIKAKVKSIEVISTDVFLVQLSYDLSYCYKENINTFGVVGYTEDKFEFGKTAYRTKEDAERASNIK